MKTFLFNERINLFYYLDERVILGPNPADIYILSALANLYSAKNNVYEKDCLLLAKWKERIMEVGKVVSMLDEEMSPTNGLNWQ